MSYDRHIPWFNPREMSDTTVQTLSTGRDALLADFFKTVRQRLSYSGPGSHWLVKGPRGAGKSYFLRLVQTCFSEFVGNSARFVLLPEEHSNISAPHELLREIKRMLNIDKGDMGVPSAWRVKDEEAAWNLALIDLMGAWEGSLLVVGVENFDQLMAQAFDNEVRSARLRILLAHEPRLMFLATAVQGEFDESYANRFFLQFEHHEIPKWDEEAHHHYLQRRAKVQGKIPTLHQLARIKAYSRYTGGNARVAAVLAGAILDEQDPLTASADLNATMDRMTDYYRAQLDRIPLNTRKLFDALIRGGEPASQTQIAERVGARQSDISRAFAWLTDYGYLFEEREPGHKEKRYLVADRLFVQFYRMRYLQPGQRTQLALLADLLADTIEFRDKWLHAARYLNDGHENEACHTARLASLEAAWKLLDKNEPKQSALRIRALGQLGYAVFDCARMEGEVKAFALGCNLLEEVAARAHNPAEEAIRALWTSMIDMGVPHTVLRDLLGEVERIFADRHTEVKMLCKVLSVWLDDLDCPPAERAKIRKTLDPDIATTIEALGQNLSAAAKVRLKLDQ